MSKFVKAVIVLAIALAALAVFVPREASAQCMAQFPAGHWEAEGRPSLVAVLDVQLPCNDTAGRGYDADPNVMPPASLPQFHVVALCGSGTCDWGWSPGFYGIDSYQDHRVWANATTEQTFSNLGNDRLRVKTIVRTGGEKKEFTDTLRRVEPSARTNVRPRTYTVAVSYRVLEATSDGGILAQGGHGNEFRPQVHMTRGVYVEQHDWQASASLPVTYGSVDIRLRLMEDDDGLLGGGDDRFDISPDESDKDLRMRVDLENRYIYLVRDWHPVSHMGYSDIPFVVQGRNGEDRAKIEVLVTVRPGFDGLQLPAPAPAAPAPAAPATAPGAFRLVDAQSNLPMGGLSDGAEVNLRTLPSPIVNLLTDFAAPVESVVYYLDGQPFCINGRCLENSAPYYMAGDIDGDPYDNWNWGTLLGTHTLTAVPCEKDNGQPPCGAPRSITITIVNR